MRLLLNGRLNRRPVGSTGRDPSADALHLGQLSTATASRQFVGPINEIAGYLPALDDTAVSGHYDSMFGRDQLK